jgi:prepilin-type N-terminal cleavage/methylation domain-containing protein
MSAVRILDVKMNIRIEPKLNTSDRQAQVMKGFTLLEVMIVVAIIGIMGSIGIPAMQKWLQDGAVKNGARSLMFHMKEARVTAMAESRKVWITFDAYSYTYDAVPTAGQTCGRCKKINITFDQFSGSMKMFKVVGGATTTLTPPSISFSSQSVATPRSVDIVSSTSKSRVVVNMIGRAYMCSQQQIASNTCG